MAAEVLLQVQFEPTRQPRILGLPNEFLHTISRVCLFNPATGLRQLSITLFTAPNSSRVRLHLRCYILDEFTKRLLMDHEYESI